MKHILVITALAAACAPALSADLAKGKQLADTQCAACHGPEGNKPIDPSYPRLAGQYADYLAKVLVDYQKGLRKNAIMGGIAKPLTRADIENVSAYYASVPGVLGDRKAK
jgi:cytochrome c553